MTPKKLPLNDPIAAGARRAKAQRRVGLNQQCSECGESRPEALISGTNPIICASCDRRRKGKTVMDNHHPAGKANSPITIPVDVNDHRAELSAAQYDWPKQTLQNPDGSPLLKAAACVRGFIDLIIYWLNKLLGWIPEMLEWLHKFLLDKLGPNWWLGTPMERSEPQE